MTELKIAKPISLSIEVRSKEERTTDNATAKARGWDPNGPKNSVMVTLPFKVSCIVLLKRQELIGLNTRDTYSIFGYEFMWVKWEYDGSNTDYLTAWFEGTFFGGLFELEQNLCPKFLEVKIIHQTRWHAARFQL